MEDGKYNAIAHGVEEFVGMPRCSKGAGFCFAIAHHTGNDKIGVIKGCAIGMGKCITKLSAFVDGSWSFRRNMAWYAPWERELFEECHHAFFVSADGGVDFGIGAIKPSVGDEGGPAMAWPGDIKHTKAVLANQPVEMSVNQIEAGTGAPMAY